MKSKSARSATRIVNAFTYSMQGIRQTWRDEAAFRQEVAGFVPLAAVTLALDIPAVHTAVILAMMCVVLGLELLNSGLEALVDKTSPEKHALAGKAKDCGSAAVLLGMLGLAIVWLMLAGPAAWKAVAVLLR